MRTPARLGSALLGLALATGVAACGDDSDDAADTTLESTTTTASGPQTFEVTAADYAFEDLPESVPAGSKLTLTNSSTIELHEMVVIRIPDGEDRPVSELVQLPEEELGAMFAEEPAMVLLRPPGAGAAQIDAVGDGTLSEPGRYAVVCFIPQGADPDAYLEAPPGDGPPEVEGGPPHAFLGMHGEITVE